MANTSEGTTASDTPQGLDPVLFITGGSGDVANLNCVYVRLLLAKIAKFPYIDAVLRDYDSDMLMEIERHLWVYGGEFWRDIVEKCHRLVIRSLQPTSPAPAGTSIFQDVKANVRLEIFAARFTTLRRAGPDSQKGSCPLHEEKDASFYVVLSKQRWNCYGACGTGGDIVRLAKHLMEVGRYGE